MGTNLKDNRQGVENQGADKAPVAHYAPKSKVVTNNVADPHLEAKKNGAVFSGAAKYVSKPTAVAGGPAPKPKHP
jgi:hypothetical protein